MTLHIGNSESSSLSYFQDSSDNLDDLFTPEASPSEAKAYPAQPQAQSQAQPQSDTGGSSFDYFQNDSCNLDDLFSPAPAEEKAPAPMAVVPLQTQATTESTGNAVV